MLMRIVIDISKEKYQTYINHTEAILDNSTPLVHQDLLRAVINGTPLPEHHGRLIDADVVIEDATKGMKYAVNHEYMECVIAHMKLAPTIIEGSDSE